MRNTGTKIHSFGKRVQGLRKNKGLTQAELAEKMDVSEEAVKRWEQGRSTPSKESLDKISNFFQCDYDYLLGRQDTPNKIYQHISEYTGLSERAVSILATAKTEGSPLVNIINSLILDDTGILAKLQQSITADYGVASRFIEIDDPFSPNGKTPILVDPRRLQQADSMELYNMILKFIDKQREENEMSPL